MHVSQKTAPFSFCNNFVKHSSILIILACIYCTSVNFLPQTYFTFFIKSKAENQLKFKQYNTPAQRVRTIVKLLRRETGLHHSTKPVAS